MSIETVFVIGAGASQEVNLPTGYELKSKISKLLDIRFNHQQISGDFVITDALRELVKDASGRSGNINPYLHEAWHIRDALPLAISIDNFIDNQRENEKIALCGKLAIARSILEAEKKSKLFFDRLERNPGIKFGTLEETWYLSFFQLVTENCDVSELEKRFRSIKLIIFNYDRCVEHFLFHALQKYYKISEADAAQIFKALTIHHPYGSVGQLPWLQNGSPIEFGAEPQPKQLLELTKKIKTFTEGTDPNESDITFLKENVFKAQRLVFIGFAFHKLNMKLLTPEPSVPLKKSQPRCYASTFGISASDKKVIKGQVSRLYQSNIDLEMADLKCKSFFSEFWRSLSF